MDTRELLAWAAGFFDGEGTVCLSSHRARVRTPAILAGVAQSKTPELLERFRSIVGFGSICYRPPRRVKTAESWYWLTQSHEAVQALCCLLWPWLGTIKRQQFARVLKAWRNAPMRRRAFRRLPSRHHVKRLASAAFGNS